MARARASSSRSGNSCEEEERVQKLLEKWNPPKVAVYSIYHRKGILDCFSSSSSQLSEIKKLENTVAIRKECEDFQLIHSRIIQEHKRSYSFIHLGHVQVAVKPLTANGLNSSVLVCLRDSRIKFSQSRLALVESTLHGGPIYFNCYPSGAVTLNDANCVNLKIKVTTSTGGDRPGDFSGSAKPDIEVFYRMCYKLTAYGPFDRTKASLSLDRTPFIETNLLRKDMSALERTVEWESIQVPEIWNTP